MGSKELLSAAGRLHVRLQADIQGNEVSFALHDPAMAIAPLFRPMVSRKRPKGLEVNTKFSGYDLKFTCWEWLDVRDQSVLFGLIGLAAMRHEELRADNDTEVGLKLWTDLQPAMGAVEGRAIVVTTKRAALLRAADQGTSAGDYARLKETLYRLSQVGCRVKGCGYEWSMQMLSYASKADGTIHVALNERFAQAILGHHVRINLEERRQIKGESALVLHSWLSAITRPGSRGIWMGLDAVALKVWGHDLVTADTQRWRRRELIGGLEKLLKLSWGVELKGRGRSQQMRITRPKSKIG